MPGEGRPDNNAPSPPIPKAQKGDLEDVSWALSTAEASWQRGDRMESLKWLRRAAEAATEGSMNARALFLAKAAADLTSVLGRPGSPQPPTAAGAARGPAAPPRVAPLSPSKRPGPQAPAPAVVTRPSAPPPPVPRPAGGSVHAAMMPPRAGPAAPMSARGQPAAKMRKSSQSLEAEAKASRGSTTGEAQRPTVPGSPPASVEPRRRRSNALAQTDADAPTEPGTRDSPIRRAPSVADEIDAWPTETMVGTVHDLIAGPAQSAAPTARAPSSGSGSVTQAVRVLVWRTPEGLRIAPVGTAVQASVTVEAMLVALDPAADLAGWLVRR